MTDPIADFLIRIKNASLADHKTISAPYSSAKERLAQVLKKEGFLEKVEVIEEKKKKQLVVAQVGGQEGRHPIEVKRISKPGRRVYVKASGIPVLKRGLGTIIISSPIGLVTADEAIKKNIGGELICKIF